ncbi:glutaredoxin family protein [Paucibacter sp. Y2R2-4]|uniref:glutaredoxin family protein n=1 Tax=Paucibacter sp. Y2R2-4 TaxID=2893553 RepID=UPI0021E3852C|nr:glutaredoxin [Paucibacter sp. Y2R2-4]MCV2349353.1 glutaredoxin [Paucibacter sp. Y2R2-4]
MKPLIRLFFRTLRLLLGPVMLLKERLTRPQGLQRQPAEQARIDRECEGLVLYQFKTCPFCIRVRQEIHRLSLPIPLLDAQHNAQHRAELLQATGASKVPCLRIRDANGQSQWLSESKAINAYLQGRFAN